MAKYRITSMPQSLPKAQKGLFKNKLDIKTPQNKFKNLFDKGVLDNKGHINLFGKNKKRNSNQQTAPQETWSGVTPDLIQPGQDPFELKPTYTPFAEFTQSEVNVNDTLNKIAEERARLAEEKENKDWEEMMQKREEAFKTSKKYDKIEPLYTIDSEGYTDEDLAGFQESGFFAVKDPKTNKINLYPTNEINSRIINNGLRTNEIVNKLGIGDEKLIQGSFGDLMKAADEEYGSTVQSKLLEKSLDEGISLEEAAKKLSGKLGTEKGIQNYIKPTKKLINTYIDNIKADINKPAEKELKSMYLDNRDPNATYSPKIDYNSADPGLKYNMDYYNTTGDWGKFLKDYSDYNKEYSKEYADSFYNKQNQNADRLNLPVSLQPETLKNQLDLTNQNILLTKQIGDASTEAGNKTINKKYIEQLQADMTRASDPLVKYELSKKLDAVKNNPEAFSKLLKKFDTGEVFTKEDEDDINALTFNILQNESQDAIKDLRIKPELTTKDKVLDVLANPFDAFKYSNQGGLNNMWSSGMGYNERKLLERANPGLDLGTQDNLVGNALNTWNPMRFARDVDSDLDRGDYESAGLEALEFATPAIFSKAARAGRLARDASKFFPTGKIAPGLRGFTGATFDAMNPYFAYEAVRPGGDFNRSYDAFQSGDIRGGLEEGAYGALGLLGVKGTKGLKGFNTPLTKPFNANRLAFKKGGSLPTYQGPIRSIVKGTKNIAKTALNLKDAQKSVSKLLSDNVYKNILTELQPDKMKLISELKNEGLLSKTLNEGALVNYPNLLDLATKKGIQAKNTVFRSTRPFLGNSNILRSSENTESELPLQYFNYLKSLPSDVSRAAYMSSHISPINVGARTGLDHVIGMNSPMDALYYSRQNLNNPNIEYTYGPLQTELRFPFDFSEGDSSTWLQKYRDMPFRYKLEDGKTVKNKEYAPGVIHNMDILSGSQPGSEGAILGLRNQRVLEPVRVRYNETYKNLEDEESLNNYFYDIMSKRSPEEQGEYIAHFNNEILPKLDFPKDYFKDRYAINFGPAQSLYDTQNYLWHHNRRLKDLSKDPSNVQVIPYSPFSFGFEKGGSLPTYQGPIRSIVKSITPKLTNLALKTGIKTLQLPGVKPFLRSNYNPISYPIKLLGEKIARQNSAPYRNEQNIIDALTKKAAPEKQLYFGNVNMGDPEYGYGKRDLIANYFRGKDAGFKPIDYDIYSDPGLKKYIDRYGHLKTYELNSEIKHGDPLDILSLAPNMIIKSKNPVFKDNISYYPLGPGHSEHAYFQMPGLEDYYYSDYMNNLPGTSTPSLYEAQRQYYKKMLHQHFDEQGIESLDLDVDPKEYRTNRLYYNPIFPKDNLAGHMGIIKRTPDKKDFEFTTRDIWKFTPDDYIPKWDPRVWDKNDLLFKNLQIEGMDAFGKPFVLTQTNPIKFKEGGSVELELTPKQIKEYIKKGYIIEDI